MVKKKLKLPHSEKDLLANMTSFSAHADELAKLTDAEIEQMLDAELSETDKETLKNMLIDVEQATQRASQAINDVLEFVEKSEKRIEKLEKKTQ